MKRILLLLALLALPVAASAQLVQSSSMIKVKEKTESVRKGWSVAATLEGSYMIRDHEVYSKKGLGLYADAGYFFNSWIYLGLTAGVHYEDVPDIFEGERTKRIAPQVLLNPRFYFMNNPTSPFIDLRGGVSLAGTPWGRLELLAGCAIFNNFEIAAGVANPHYAFGSEVIRNLEVTVRAGYRFYF